MRTGQAPINGGRWMLAQGGEETWIGRALAPQFWTILDSIYARARRRPCVTMFGFRGKDAEHAASREGEVLMMGVFEAWAVSCSAHRALSMLSANSTH